MIVTVNVLWRVLACPALSSVFICFKHRYIPTPTEHQPSVPQTPTRQCQPRNTQQYLPVMSYAKHPILSQIVKDIAETNKGVRNLVCVQEIGDMHRSMSRDAGMSGVACLTVGPLIPGTSKLGLRSWLKRGRHAGTPGQRCKPGLHLCITNRLILPGC